MNQAYTAFVEKSPVTLDALYVLAIFVLLTMMVSTYPKCLHCHSHFCMYVTFGCRSQPRISTRFYFIPKSTRVLFLVIVLAPYLRTHEFRIQEAKFKCVCVRTVYLVCEC